jgi:hypothetical protein
MLTPFDTLVDAIVNYSGYRLPGSAPYKARNPGALKAFSPTAPRDELGLRIFKSDIDGLQALKFDVRHKLSGKSKIKCSTLGELADAYKCGPGQARAWAGFIRQALETKHGDHDTIITPKTPLAYFQEQK